MIESGLMDPRVLELIRRAASALDPLDVPYAVGGAVAMAAHGYARYTSDLDIFALDEGKSSILRALRKEGFIVEPLMPPMHYIAFLREHGDPTVRVDILFPADEPALSAIEYPVTTHIAGTDVKVFPVDMLVAAKFYSDRPQDLHDIAAMLERGIFEPEEVHRLIGSIDPEGAADFAVLIQELRRPRRRRPPPKRK
jgi:hypothetical protein